MRDPPSLLARASCLYPPERENAAVAVGRHEQRAVPTGRDACERALWARKRGHAPERLGDDTWWGPDRQSGGNGVARPCVQIELDQLPGTRVDDVEPSIDHENALRTA